MPRVSMGECAGRPGPGDRRTRGRVEATRRGPWRWVGGAACAAVVLAAAPTAARAETLFQVDLRVGGFYGDAGKVEGGGLVGGVHLGAVTWLGGDPIVGLLYEGGLELGPQLSPGKITGTAVFAGAIGPAFLLAGEPRHATMLSVAWAPRLFLNFAAAEIASPLGAEVSINASYFKLPIWFLRTLDKTTFFGASVGVELMR